MKRPTAFLISMLTAASVSAGAYAQTPATPAETKTQDSAPQDSAPADAGPKAAAPLDRRGGNDRGPRPDGASPSETRKGGDGGTWPQTRAPRVDRPQPETRSETPQTNDAAPNSVERGNRTRGGNDRADRMRRNDQNTRGRLERGSQQSNDGALRADRGPRGRNIDRNSGSTAQPFDDSTERRSVRPGRPPRGDWENRGWRHNRWRDRYQSLYPTLREFRTPEERYTTSRPIDDVAEEIAYLEELIDQRQEAIARAQRLMRTSPSTSVRMRARQDITTYQREIEQIQDRIDDLS